MKSFDFEYDGVSLSDKGFIICNFGSNGMKTVSNGSHITFNTVSTMKGSKHELISAEYEDCLSTTFQICKHPCIANEEEISVEEIRDISRWLNRKEFHKFKFLCAEHINIFFEASFNISKIELDGKVCGLELEMFTNRPYALSEPVSLIIRNLVDNGIKKISSLSDEEGFIYPEMEIYIQKDGDLKIYNQLEDRTMSIANCKSGEIIKLNYPMIESSRSSHYIQNDFNWKFFRLANSFKDRINEITISIPCTIKIKYTPVIKIGVE